MEQGKQHRCRAKENYLHLQLGSKSNRTTGSHQAPTGPSGLDDPVKPRRHAAASRLKCHHHQYRCRTSPPGSLVAARKLASPRQPRWGPNGTRSGPSGRRQPPAPPCCPAANERVAALRTTRSRDPSHRARPSPANHTAAGRRSLDPPPSARGKEVHRRRHPNSC
jgi:hypothetical protein